MKIKRHKIENAIIVFQTKMLMYRDQLNVVGEPEPIDKAVNEAYIFAYAEAVSVLNRLLEEGK